MIIVKKHKAVWQIFNIVSNKPRLIGDAEAIALENARFKSGAITGNPVSAYGLRLDEENERLIRACALHYGKYMPGWLDTRLYTDNNVFVVGRKIVESAKLVLLWGEHVAAKGVVYVQRDYPLHTSTAFNRSRA